MHSKELAIFCVLFFVLFYLSSFFSDPFLFALCDPCGCPDQNGFPLTFFQKSLEPGSIEMHECNYLNEFDFNALFIDIIFWMAVSFGLIHGIERIRKK